MKSNCSYFLSFILFLLCIQVKAQNECGSDKMHFILMQTDSAYRANYLQVESQLQLMQPPPQRFFPMMQPPPAPILTFPIVVHVIHLGEPVGTGTNLSDAVILDAISGLNDRFRNIIGSSLDTEMQFCLATRDPDGNATTGINRVNGSGITNYSASGITGLSCGVGANEDSIKALSRWSVTNYYNIWIVKSICGGTYSGYAYFPSGALNDGATISHSYFTYNDLTTAHELGHAFNLFHTFNGDASGCPANGNCNNDGDKICDTPPHRQADCGATNPCSATGTWDNSRYNYMSYCFPSMANARFTSNQKDRMRNSTVFGPRASLLNSLG